MSNPQDNQTPTQHPDITNPDGQPARRIARKDDIWHWIKRGVIMQLHFDLETGGLDRRGGDHSTRGYPVITEYGDVLADISGNLLNTEGIFPKRPEWIMPEPAAAIVQRMEDGVAEYDKEDRKPYFQAMSEIAWRFDNAAYLYDMFGDKTTEVSFTDHNKQAKGPKECTENVISLPLKLDNGEIVEHVRYHPDRKRISYRYEESDTESPYYENIDNLYYVDADGTKWRWVDPCLKVSGFNVKNYDIPVLRTNMMRAGMHPKNIPFIYSRATITNKQKKKNYLVDERDIALNVVLHGAQGEEALQLSEVVNPETGKLYPSEALGRYFTANDREPNNIRYVPGGLLMPDGTKFDLNVAHQGVMDSIASLALSNYCHDIASDIVSIVEKQSDEDNCIRMLNDRDPKGKKLPLVSLQRKDFPSRQSDSLYYFMDTDDQLGRFKDLVFIHTTGALRYEKFNEKPINELGVDEWAEYFEKTRGNPDRPVRLESYRRWRGAIPFNDVMKVSKEAGRYRDMIEDVDKDMEFLIENPQMRENIRTALARINAKKRFKVGPQNPIPEDEWPIQGFGNIYYQEDALAKERTNLAYLRHAKKGPYQIKGILETLKNRMQDDFDFLNMADEATMRIFVAPHQIDFVNEDDPGAEEILENYLDLCKRAYQKLRSKDAPQIKAMGKYFMKGGTPRFKYLAAAKRFRDAMRTKAMDDYLAEMKSGSNYADGLVDKDSARGTRKLLFANPARGEDGSTPHVVDKSGREVPIEYIKRLAHGDSPKDRNTAVKQVIDKFKNKEWSLQFYRLRSDPIIDIVIKFCVDNDKIDLIPSELYEHYKARRQLTLYGPPNEDATTSRYANIKTFEYDQKRLEINAKQRGSNSLERASMTRLGAAANLVKHDEGQRILAKNRTWLKALKKKYPYDSKLNDSVQYDPKSGMPYDYIPYEIEAGNTVTIDIPAQHLRYPINQYDVRLPHRCVVVPKLDEDTQEKIKDGAKLILREAETGRQYYPGPVSVHAAPKDSDTSFANVNNTARRAYAQSGTDYPDEANRVILGIEDLYPIANTRKINAERQTIKLPSLHFDALTCPQISSLGAQTLRAAIVPLDYCPQKLDTGKRIQLRETACAMFENIKGEAHNDTGHIYETRLKKVTGLDKAGNRVGITLRDLFNKLSSGEINQKLVRECGFLGLDNMKQKMEQWSKEQRKDHDPLDQQVMVLEFDKVRKDSWAYFNPPEAPDAAITKDGKPVPPSAYQPY